MEWRGERGYGRATVSSKHVYTLAVAFSLGLGCAGAPPPTHQLSESKAAVRAAEEVGATKAPQAALHLKMARDQIAQAEALIRDEEHEDARYLLKRAEADAELAIALAKAQAERDAAEETKHKIQRLEQQATP